MRNFLGLALPDSTKTDLERICFGLEEIRWVSPENFHTTLVFLGELKQEEIERVSEICSEVSEKSFSLEINGVGVFGNKAPEILYVGVALSEGLKKLQKVLESTLRRQGFQIDKRDYRPHITIGRFKRAPEKRLDLYLKEFEGFKTDIVPVSEFQLFSSRSGANGQIYSVEESYPLLSE
ncbi:RNA 2',3'-cyclic phosphodiesterase [Leptospira sarikeiensis]|uniref:RNA 2',3'-cyclic phosphodiesterase n=1 Tax=Leptospira sarikeiensis TaxID=2484943 RepID=A0A4R9K6H9_9LEPT|nr:RNA 2',3'-cyclic phosphodiesterase [Leptospira sarikeiensis]TGL60937.1 RNA 2',3'-cyclic phosphodiesterase [Leptospira sarikeiensis]